MYACIYFDMVVSSLPTARAASSPRAVLAAPVSDNDPATSCVASSPEHAQRESHMAAVNPELWEPRASMYSALRSARLPVNLIGSLINYANRLISSPITSQSTEHHYGLQASGPKACSSGGTAQLCFLAFDSHTAPCTDPVKLGIQGSVLHSDRRAVQAIGRIDRGADQNEGLNGTLIQGPAGGTFLNGHA